MSVPARELRSRELEAELDFELRDELEVCINSVRNIPVIVERVLNDLVHYERGHAWVQTDP